MCYTINIEARIKKIGDNILEYDYQLGIRIQQILKEQNLENPVNFEQIAQWDNLENMAIIKQKYTELLMLIGVSRNLQDGSKTAQRIIEMLIQENFSGLDYGNFPSFNTLENTFNYQEPLVAGNIIFQSTCEHHLVAIKGTALIAYQPQEQIIGLKKLNQVLHFFAARPQLQERLTMQVFVTLQYLLKTQNIAIVIKAQHDCMGNQNLKNDNTWHLTSQFGGIFCENKELKQSILNQV